MLGGVLLAPVMIITPLSGAQSLSLPDSVRPHGLQPSRLLCPWDSPDKNTGVGCHALLQGIFPTQGLNPHLLCLLHWQVDYLPPEPPEKPITVLESLSNKNSVLIQKSECTMQYVNYLYPSQGYKNGQTRA